MATLEDGGMDRWGNTKVQQSDLGGGRRLVLWENQSGWHVITLNTSDDEEWYMSTKRRRRYDALAAFNELVLLLRY